MAENRNPNQNPAQNPSQGQNRPANQPGQNPNRPEPGRPTNPRGAEQQGNEVRNPNDPIRQTNPNQAGKKDQI